MQNHSPRLKFNLEKLNDPQVADLFEVTIGGTFATLDLLEENIDNLTENIHGALIDTTSEVLGKARKKKKPWRLVTFWLYVTGEVSRKEEKMALLPCIAALKPIKKSEEK